jgi:hypothetical protein
MKQQEIINTRIFELQMFVALPRIINLDALAIAYATDPNIPFIYIVLFNQTALPRTFASFRERVYRKWHEVTNT